MIRFDPFREFDRLADRLLGTAMRPLGMPMDGYRQADRFVLHFDVPGVDPASIEVTVDDNVLTVSAERSWTVDDASEVLASERPHGRFTRRLLLGENLDTERIQASYQNGVLTLSIPVAEHAKRRRIEITEGAGEQKALEARAA